MCALKSANSKDPIMSFTIVPDPGTPPMESISELINLMYILSVAVVQDEVLQNPDGPHALSAMSFGTYRAIKQIAEDSMHADALPRNSGNIG